MAGETSDVEVVQHELITTRAFGRPLKWQSAIEFADQVEKYFEECATLRDVPTISGLAVYLDTDRKTLLSYKKRDDFLPTINRAKSKCEAIIESRAMLGGLNPAMSIFSLKNNYGWVDKTEVDNRHEMVKPIISLDEPQQDSRPPIDLED